ncbi:MAG: DUF4012 domain-containing protein [Patescibacteria group bacterium]
MDNTTNPANIDIPEIKPATEAETGESIVMQDRSPKSILDPEGLESYSQVMQERKAEDQKVVQKEVQMNDKKQKIKAVFKKYARPVGMGILAFLLFLGLIIGIPGYNVYAKAKKVSKQVSALKAAANKEDIVEVKKELETTKKDLTALKSSYRAIAWTKIIPFVGGFVSDGQHGINAGIYGIEATQLTVDAIEPYADLIGFKKGGQEAQSGEETANDRIEFIVETIKGITPKVDKIAEKAKLANAELDYIDPARYPETFKGKKIQENVRKVKDLANEATEMISNSKPLLEAAPYILGIDEPRTYLLIFQNDKELRPTGGFLTGYSIVTIDKGKFEQASSNDIYNLDKVYKPRIKAPDPIIDYIKGPYVLNPNLRLRDMNFNPDFKESMDLFTEEIKSAGVNDIDGVIAVDTHVVVNILKVLGQIGVPGFGNFSAEPDARCNCPQVVYELEDYADQEGAIVWDQNDPTKIIFAPANFDNRKKIVGPLMNSVLSNALGQPKEKLPALFEAGWKSISEKHVLMYLFDDQAQKGVESFNIAGRIKNYEGDYLHISDSNLGGRKSNLYVTQEVHQDVVIKKDGTVEKTVEITYKNPQSYDGWLNSVLPNWTRIYVPKGSKLVDISGFEDKVDPYEDLGKTVFAGGFSLRPQGVVKVKLVYTLPNKLKNGNYNILIQKQPGTDLPLHTLTIGKQQKELFLATDKEFKFKI